MQVHSIHIPPFLFTCIRSQNIYFTVTEKSSGAAARYHTTRGSALQSSSVTSIFVPRSNENSILHGAVIVFFLVRDEYGNWNTVPSLPNSYIYMYVHIYIYIYFCSEATIKSMDILFPQYVQSMNVYTCLFDEMRYKM